MRQISPSMRHKLDACASSLCNCWRIVRKDGVVMGFTDHDRDLAFGGVDYRASSGFSATQMEAALGMSIGSGEILGALRSDMIAEIDLANGIYDGASVEIWLVDWSEVADRMLVDAATIGEVKRSEFAFSAELRSIAHLFDAPHGESFQRSCAADLGDSRCGVDLELSSFRTTGVVVAAVGASFSAALAAETEEAFFAYGRSTFTSGANIGVQRSVKSHVGSGASARFTLWAPPAEAIAVGDAFEIVAGCDKSAATCGTKFGNIINFRGFPHMPGNDGVVTYPSANAPTMDGGSLFR
jgi:uncharacterized phage protein (TIGR02218 family)